MAYLNNPYTSKNQRLLIVFHIKGDKYIEIRGAIQSCMAPLNLCSHIFIPCNRSLLYLKRYSTQLVDSFSLFP